MTDKQSTDTTDTWAEMYNLHLANDASGCNKFMELENLHKWSQYFLDGYPIERSQLRALKEWVGFLQKQWVISQGTIACILVKLAENDNESTDG